MLGRRGAFFGEPLGMRCSHTSIFCGAKIAVLVACRTSTVVFIQMLNRERLACDDSTKMRAEIMLDKYRDFLDEKPAKAILTFIVICILILLAMGVSVQYLGIVGWVFYAGLGCFLIYWLFFAGFLVAKRLIKISTR